MVLPACCLSAEAETVFGCLHWHSRLWKCFLCLPCSRMQGCLEVGVAVAECVGRNVSFGTSCLLKSPAVLQNSGQAWTQFAHSSACVSALQGGSWILFCMRVNLLLKYQPASQISNCLRINPVPTWKEIQCCTWWLLFYRSGTSVVF